MKNEVQKVKTYDVEAFMKSIVNLMFTQMKATQGFNLFGECMLDAMIKWLKQF